MNKKTWKDKLSGLIKLRKVAEFHKEKAINDMEELDFMISAFKKKIERLK